MAHIGVLIETDSTGVKVANFGVLTAAQGENNQITAFVIGATAASCSETLGRYGASRVVEVTAQGGDLGKSPDLQAGLMVDAAKEYKVDFLLGLCSSKGKDLMARIAALADAPLAQDCLSVNFAARTVVKPFFSGRTTATLQLNGPLCLCTIRPNAIEEKAQPVSVETAAFSSARQADSRLVIKEVKTSQSGRVDISEANIIITGGRPLGSADNFQILGKCADAVGGAVGASRVAVDLGYASHSMQVGQTGKTVSPRLYIACGLSGSVQHFAGMKTSKVIVAINNDKDAPIFQKCDYGIIGDLFEVVPALTEALAKR